MRSKPPLPKPQCPKSLRRPLHPCLKLQPNRPLRCLLLRPFAGSSCRRRVHGRCTRPLSSRLQPLERMPPLAAESSATVPSSIAAPALPQVSSNRAASLPVRRVAQDSTRAARVPSIPRVALPADLPLVEHPAVRAAGLASASDPALAAHAPVASVARVLAALAVPVLVRLRQAKHRVHRVVLQPPEAADASSIPRRRKAR